MGGRVGVGAGGSVAVGGGVAEGAEGRLGEAVAAGVADGCGAEQAARRGRAIRSRAILFIGVIVLRVGDKRNKKEVIRKKGLSTRKDFNTTPIAGGRRTERIAKAHEGKAVLGSGKWHSFQKKKNERETNDPAPVF